MSRPRTRVTLHSARRYSLNRIEQDGWLLPAASLHVRGLQPGLRPFLSSAEICSSGVPLPVSVWASSCCIGQPPAALHREHSSSTSATHPDDARDEVILQGCGYNFSFTPPNSVSPGYRPRSSLRHSSVRQARDSIPHH